MNANAGTDAPSHAQINAAVMRRFIDAVVNRGDYAALPALVHPEYVYRSPEQTLQGVDALQALLEAYREGMPDIHTRIEDMVVAGDAVVIAIELTGTHSGDLMGIAATGQRVCVQGMVMSRFEDGRIVEEREMLDMLGLFQQLGVVSFPP